MCIKNIEKTELLTNYWSAGIYTIRPTLTQLVYTV